MSNSYRKPIEGLTIDSPSSYDLDDAFWLENVENGYILHISITDVGEQIPLDSPLDKAAYQRCFTRYLRESNVGMFPHHYSEDALSLLAGKARNTITLSIPIDDDANTQMPTIHKTLLRSKAKLSYESAAVIMADSSHPYHQALNKSYQLSQILFQKRRQNGAISLYNLQQGLATSEDGVLQRIAPEKAYNSHILIQEFMILSNQLIARFFAEHDIPALYRNHTTRAVAPPRDSLIEDIDNAVNLGNVERIETLISKFALIFNKAEYAPIIEGHYALNLPAYTHFSSPIRRYADLVNIRQLGAFIAGETLPYSNEDLAEIGQHINDVTDEYKRKQGQFFKKKQYKQQLDLLDENDYSGLNSNEFYVLLKAAISENRLSDYLEDEINARLQNKSLSHREIFLVLFRAKNLDQWQVLRRSIMKSMSENLADSTTLLAMASQTFQWQVISYQTEMIHNAVTPSFATIATLKTHNKQYLSDCQKNNINIKTKKLSEQLANYNLLAKVLKIDLDFPDFYKKSSLDTVSEDAIKQVHSQPQATINAVGKLVELYQKKGWENVQYHYKEKGESHRPIFQVEASITINGQEYLACVEKSAAKKTVKQFAAAQLIETIKHLPKSKKKSAEQTTENFIGLLNNYMQIRRQDLPYYEFDLVERSGIEQFQCSCIVVKKDKTTLNTVAYGINKKFAKKSAAKLMWEKLH